MLGCSACGSSRPPFGNDFSSADAVAQAVAEESAALAALGEELVGGGRPFVTISGTPYVPGRVSTEADPLPTDGQVGGRGRAVMAVCVQACNIWPCMAGGNAGLR